MRGVKKSENFVDVINGRPQSPGTHLVRDLLVARPLEVEVAEDGHSDAGVLFAGGFRELVQSKSDIVTTSGPGQNSHNIQ